ncbi:MAG: agmatine deiminase family protein [Deltaproteobacteria bacterium]|nr:agmatine deiminase family protein [Deltaproteobacteria bacterium]MBN2673014.1 agmatine deiminase family protein [Deltaproteobacteria bacterium]
MNQKIVLPAEWAPQSGVQLTWPHADTDWRLVLDDAELCFVRIAEEISAREILLVVCRDAAAVRGALSNCRQGNLRIVEIDCNDTWARDHGGITVLKNGTPTVLDFTFNGWGKKFESDLDNRITGAMADANLFFPEVAIEDHLDFVLEGGSIESDGAGTILTTSTCLLSENRNDGLNRSQIEYELKRRLGAERVLWLDHGFLEGDDTDSHIDTLARFCDTQTIAYVACDDSDDIHFSALQQMKNQLESFRTLNGMPYRLVPLPMADASFDAADRLPATYANFLILNHAVLVPVYNSPKDEIALQTLKSIFSDRDVVGIDCRVLIKQHGSLHCVTMQYPEGVLR